MRERTRLGLAGLLGAAIGASVWLIDRPVRAPQRPNPVELATHAAEGIAGDGHRSGPFPAPVDAAPAAAGAGEPTLEDIDRGWSQVRDDHPTALELETGFVQFQSGFAATPFEVGIALAEGRTLEDEVRREAVEGGAIALLDRIAESGGGPAVGLVRDEHAFDTLFAREYEEQLVDPLAGRPWDRLEDGTTVRFPPGIHALTDLVRPGGRLPADVTIAGAGCDHTLFVVAPIRSREPVVRLRFTDCTLYTGGRPLLDLGGSPALIDFERVRLLGFEPSPAFGVRTKLVLRARDSRLEGGYGHTTREGALFDPRSPAVAARFARCDLHRLALGLDALAGRTAVAFAECFLTDLLDSRSPAAVAGVVFERCRIELGDPDATREPLLVEDLFPAFEPR